MRIFTENTLAIAIDYQEKLIPVIDNNQTVVIQACRFAKGCQLLSLPMLVTRQYPKGLGDTISALQEVTEQAEIYDKSSFSIFDDDKIRQSIKEKQAETILLFGVETHICVAQSAIDLNSAGYQVFIVEDACGCRKAIDNSIALKRFHFEGIGIISVEAALFELTRSATHPSFKEISKLIK